MATDRRKFLQRVGIGALAASFPASIKKALADSRSSPHRDHRRRRAHRHPHAGEPIVRSLLRHAARRARVRRSARGQAALGRPGLEAAERHRPRDCRFIRTRRTSGCNFSRTCRTTGPTATPPGIGGKYDQWVPSKGTTTMAYLTRNDIPIHFALADAFTVCDAYHCSLLGPTDPNRYHMWTGWVGQRRSGTAARCSTTPRPATTGRPIPERLQKAGVSLEDLSGCRRRTGRRALLGLGRRRVHRQLRRQLAPLLPPVPECAAGEPALRGGAHRHQHLAGRNAVRPVPPGRARQQAPAGVVDRGAGGVHGAPELAGELRRLVRLADSSTRSRRTRRSGARRRSS